MSRDPSNPDDPGARVLAENMGFEIVDADSQVWFFDRELQAPTIAAAVSGGVGGIAAINSIVFSTMMASHGELTTTWPIVLVMAAITLIGFGVCRFSLVLRRRRIERPRAQLQLLARLDRRTGMVHDARGAVIAPVGQVRGKKAMLIGSSAPAVVLAPPNHRRIVVFHGSMFGGGVEHVLQLLATVGFAR